MHNFSFVGKILLCQVLTLQMIWLVWYWTKTYLVWVWNKDKFAKYNQGLVLGMVFFELWLRSEIGLEYHIFWAKIERTFCTFLLKFSMSTSSMKCTHKEKKLNSLFRICTYRNIQMKINVDLHVNILYSASEIGSRR